MDPQKKAEQLREKLLKLGPMLPGSISEQWNVCGTPGCKCKDPVSPQKHGPYYQLSFSVGGKSSSLFERAFIILDLLQSSVPKAIRYLKEEIPTLIKNCIKSHQRSRRSTLEIIEDGPCHIGRMAMIKAGNEIV